MNIEELIKRINDLDFGYKTAGTRALVATVKLHEQVEDYCAECSDPEGGMTVIFPCPTLKGIEKELND